MGLILEKDLKSLMFRYQILIEYVGTNFRGWQVQKKGKTIQGLIQQKISKILKEKIILIGSGRTDSGVHAIGQSAHFECNTKIENFDKFLKSTNHFLNRELVTILKIKKAPGTGYSPFIFPIIFLALFFQLISPSAF